MLHLLSRRVRFAVNPGNVGDHPGPNGYAGNPPLRPGGAYFEVIVRCARPLDPRSQYVVNIKEIDAAFRDHALPRMRERLHTQPGTNPSDLLADITATVSKALPGMVGDVRWQLTPYYSLAMSPHDLDHAFLRQRFDFCAAHRLHNPALSEAENRAVFGKCNNPSGHGHNYQFEPCVRIPVSAAGFSLHDLEHLAEELVIARFDHKNLNTDTAEFRDGSGVFPTVEQIARVCYELLAPAIAQRSARASLQSVTVWESDRTSCTYPAERISALTI